MKKLLLIATLAIVISVAQSCKKTAEKAPEETFTQYPVPTWKVDETGKYSSSMTAVVSLPTALKTNMREGDKLGAFVNDECRGEGVIVKMDTAQVFFVLIKGTATEQTKIKFRYYSTKTLYLYDTPANLTFNVDANYGTAEAPKTIELTPLK